MEVKLVREFLTVAVLLLFAFVQVYPATIEDSYDLKNCLNPTSRFKKPKFRKIYKSQKCKNIAKNSLTTTIPSNDGYPTTEILPVLHRNKRQFFPPIFPPIGGVPLVPPLTDKEKKDNINYLLFNLENQKLGQELNNRTVLDETMWLKGHKSVFLIHGFMQSGKEEPGVPKAGRTSENIKNAYMESNRTENIILVSWDRTARQLNYFQIAKDTFVIGEALADMLISLQKRKFLEYSQVKLVGFSLGAQIAGVAGYFIRVKTGQKIAEITGLDPAGPAFEAHVDLKLRVDKTDADFVQIVHCNMGDLASGNPHLGSSVESGHVDFFPNGGSNQPGCEKIDAGVTPCSHAKCCQLYSSTVRGRAYPGCECLGPATFQRGECMVCNGPLMGDMCDKKATGKYFMIAFPNEEDKFKDQ